ncbi:hypothetical protein [Galbitalea soli]|uniref:Uncharacterized protein n=1 Tax=Galbitalea soli TaxID=1268042 RepID=A0A7C9PLW6_9MICO|nr:hypothetical protein [Galbitalea soli]NEM90485.1 hypothetical protein [Galbitalea soli]NYJ31198.1 hypothetical protein [Galbitalea soli]
MPTDRDLHELLRQDDRPPALDAQEIIRRSRRRRRPRQLAVAVVAGAAAVSIVAGLGPVAGLFGQSVQSATSSGSLAGAPAPATVGPEDASGGSTSKSSAVSLNRCGDSLATGAASSAPLSLATEFADGRADAAFLPGSVTIRNDGSSALTLTALAQPTITLSRDGRVLWHTPALSLPAPVSVTLAPGESHRFAARVRPVECGTEDDLRQSFRGTLPHVPPGRYDVSAALDVIVDGRTVLVTGPATAITID